MKTREELEGEKESLKQDRTLLLVLAGVFIILFLVASLIANHRYDKIEELQTQLSECQDKVPFSPKWIEDNCFLYRNGSGFVFSQNTNESYAYDKLTCYSEGKYKDFLCKYYLDTINCEVLK